MGLAAPRTGYDGVVQAGMQKIQVQDGVMKVNGRIFQVSENGEVRDEHEKVVAQVKNGQLMPLQQQQQQQSQQAG